MAEEDPNTLSECPEFVMDVAVALSAQGSRPSEEVDLAGATFVERHCEFHHHPEGGSCPGLRVPEIDDHFDTLKLAQD